jgi:uncharacterized protein with HEPN domain
MPPDKDDRAYLWDMLTAAKAVVGFVQGRTLDDYGEIKHDRIWRVAVEHVPALITLLEPLVPTPPNDGSG